MKVREWEDKDIVEHMFQIVKRVLSKFTGKSRGFTKI